jgi:hypothetical protein
MRCGMEASHCEGGVCDWRADWLCVWDACNARMSFLNRG